MTAAVVPAPTRIHITGAEGSLARRLLTLFANDPRIVDRSSTSADIVIHLGAGDHDLRERGGGRTSPTARP